VLRRNGAAEFAVKVAVGQGDEHAARSAGAVAEACDALARAGWHPGQLQMDGEVARRINRTLERAPVIAGIFDRRLREQLAPQRARLCCVGWDATHWPDACGGGEDGGAGNVRALAAAAGGWIAAGVD